MKSLFKKALVFAVAGTMAISIAACGATTTSQDNTQAKTAKTVASTEAPKKASVTISWAIASSWVNYGDIKNLISKYEEESGNKIDLQPLADDQMDKIVMAKLASAEAPDIFNIPTGTQAMKYQPDQNCADLSGEKWVSRVDDSILNNSLKYFKDGKVHAFPYGGPNAIGIIYNKKVFADLGIEVPKTMQDFEAACDKIKAKNITPIYWAGKDGWTMLQHNSTVVASILGKNPGMMEKLNQNAMGWKDVPGLLDAYKKVVDWGKKGYYNKDIAAATYDQQVSAIAEGTAAMTFQGDWIAGEILKKKADAQFGIFAYPDGDGRLDINAPQGLWPYVKGKNLDTVKDFFNFLAEPDSLNIFFTAKNDIPCFKDLKVAKLNPAAEDATNNYIKTGKVGPHRDSTYLPPMSYDNQCAQYVQLLYGKMTPEEYLKLMDEDYIKAAKSLKLTGF